MPIVSSIAVAAESCFVAPFVDYPREQEHDFWRQQQHPLSLLSLLPLSPSTKIALRSLESTTTNTNNSTPTTTTAVTCSSTSTATAAAAAADRIETFDN